MQIAPVCKIYCVIVLMACLQLPVCAQQDSSKPITGQDTSKAKHGIVNYLKRQKGMFGKLASNLVGDTVASDLESEPVRNDLSFVPYEGKIIRNVSIQRLDFGTLITDTAHNFKNNFTNAANALHHKSREYVIRNNLFFKKGDKIQSFLMADNERHLRDQPYIQDVKFIIIPLYQSDSVDILIRTKDVLSIGGSIELHNATSAEFTLKEENLAGGGNGLLVGMLYNQERFKRAGYAVQYVNRNVLGSFIDVYGGYTGYESSISGLKEEKKLYMQLVRPLINAYTKWTYAFEVANHTTENMFSSDSIYNSDQKYHFFNYDAWVGWNTGAYKVTPGTNQDDRLRTLVSLRYFRQLFLTTPDKYAHQYYFIYPDIMGAIGSVSIFKQNFYKAKYFYGFGRNEDVPEGIDVSATAGWINKQGINRPYVGLDFQRYYFTPNQAYYNFTARSGSYWGNSRIEDFNILLNMDHYSRLLSLNTNWKQRTIINASVSGQVNGVLNAPLSLQSIYGLDEWRNSAITDGDFRATLKAETVFFSPYTFINFHFAPFVFGHLSAMTPVGKDFSKTDLYSSIGGGIRTRNESLIFGTFELRVFYFPRKTFTGDTWRIETTTGIKFKYNSQLIKRPVLINVNGVANNGF